MPFIPATPGIVGFGGGEKPAVFQAIAPQYSLMNQQTDDEDEPPITFCHDFIGDNLDVVVSGILQCSGCYTIGGVDVSISFTGVNGMFTAVWDSGSGTWIVIVGTITVITYLSNDGTCTGVDTTTTGDLTLSALCSGANTFLVTITGTAGLSLSVFQNDGSGVLGDALANLFTLGECGTGTLPTVAGYDGTVTVSKP